MKKLFLIVAMITMATSATFAQFGIRAGVNFNKIKVDENQSLLDNKTGWHAGCVYNFQIVDNLIGIQPGLYFSSKGYTLTTKVGLSRQPSTQADMIDDKGQVITNIPSAISNAFTGLDQEIVGTANYLEMPILLKLNFQVTEKMAIDTHIGPYFAYGIGGKYKDTDIKIFDKENLITLDRFDWGFQFGAGITFNNQIYLGWDLDLGLQKIDSEKGLGNGNLEAKNLTNMITVGVWFGND